jgi:RNA polymerase sigma-70 factor (ECF subfamily)
VSSDRTSGADDDGALALAARAGDRTALERLLHDHADRIHAVCRRIVGNPDDALDATQEAMIAVARGITRFDGHSRVSTWIYRVATNAALDELRRQRRRPVPAEAEVAFTADRDATGTVDTRLDVDAALATLPEDFRVAVVLRDLCDLDYAEIAEVLALPPGTVRSRIARGRAALEAWFREPHAGSERLSETT